MKLLATHDMSTFDEVAQHDPSTYWHRRAARAVVIDAKNRVFLMRIESRDAYKLPGGGIDEGEDNWTAVAREVREEVGVDIELVAELGKIVEYRDPVKMKQTSYCYLVRQVGDKFESSLEPEEVANGMSEVLADDIDHAISLVETNSVNGMEGRFMTLRELTVLKAAKQALVAQS